LGRDDADETRAETLFSERVPQVERDAAVPGKDTDVAAEACLRPVDELMNSPD
jgi:hypothetical protein